MEKRIEAIGFTVRGSCDLDDNHNGLWSSLSDDDSTEGVLPAKSNALAKHYREKAADQCESKYWFEAIELYNRALCLPNTIRAHGQRY